MTAYFSGPGVLVRQARVRDGLWTEKGGEPGRHISGLLVGTMLSPNSFVDHWPTLWLNPDAERPLDSNLPFPLNRFGTAITSSPQTRALRCAMSSRWRRIGLDRSQPSAEVIDRAPSSRRNARNDFRVRRPVPWRLLGRRKDSSKTCFESDGVLGIARTQSPPTRGNRARVGPSASSLAASDAVKAEVRGARSWLPLRGHAVTRASSPRGHFREAAVVDPWLAASGHAGQSLACGALLRPQAGADPLIERVRRQVSSARPHRWSLFLRRR